MKALVRLVLLFLGLGTCSASTAQQLENVGDQLSLINRNLITLNQMHLTANEMKLRKLERQNSFWFQLKSGLTSGLFLIAPFILGYILSSPSSSPTTTLKKAPPKKLSFSFEDLAGTIPQEIHEIAQSIQYSTAYTALGARAPRGILLVGPPGTGKTSLARAIAHKAAVPFIEVSASTLRTSRTGTGCENVRKLFKIARAAASENVHQKAIIFIDEFDALATTRFDTNTVMSSEDRATMQELLNQMDGFAQDTSVLLLAATNRFEDIDDAFKRPGRFDQIITIPLPNTKNREEILKFHATKIVHDQNIAFSELARETNGMSSADLENIVNEAALSATREEAQFVEYQHFLKALAIKKATYAGINELNATRTTFKDVAGTIPEDVREITDFIKNTEKYKKRGITMPRGILLVGPPGTGKTMLARAIAGEAHADFFHIAASEFIEIYVGVGPRRVRDLFSKARKSAQTGLYKKTIIFIDELDAIGSTRSSTNSSGASEYRNTLTELLRQMDGFIESDSVFVLAATNRVHDLDPALKRPGRFDRIVTIDLPTQESRKAILMYYAQKIPTLGSVNFDLLAEETAGLSGAELKSIVNEAAIHALRSDSPTTEHSHFEQAVHVRKKINSATP